MKLNEAIEEATENVDKNYSTEPCIVEILLLELKRAKIENNHNWQANEYAEKLREVGDRLARSLEAARVHGFHGGTGLLTEWAQLTELDLPNSTTHLNPAREG